MVKTIYIYAFTCLFHLSIVLNAQIPQPQFTTFTPISPSSSTPAAPNHHSTPVGANATGVINQQNAQARKMMGYKAPITETEIQADLIRKAHGDYQMQLMQKWKSEQMLEYYEIINESNNTAKPPLNYTYFNSTEFIQKTKYCENSYAEIKNMLDGKQSLNLKRAIWLSENSFYENKVPYQKFSELVGKYKKCIMQIIKRNGLSHENPMSVIWGIRSFMADSNMVYDERGNGYMHPPMLYDFNDPVGDTDYSKQFVTKLMATNMGQCHSMPLFFSMMAYEFGVPVHIAFSPAHSYIMFQDSKGNWYNYETTNGHFTSDQFVMSSGYVRQAAIKNQTYLNPLSKKQIIAYLLSDIAMIYEDKFGIADGSFMLKCADESLKQFPKNNFDRSLCIKSNVYLQKFIRLAKFYDAKKPEDLFVNVEAKAIWEKHDYYYMKVKEIGYEKMPIEEYRKWLQSLDANEWEKQNKIIQKTILIQLNK